MMLLHHTDLLGLLDSVDEGTTVLWNVSNYLPSDSVISQRNGFLNYGAHLWTSLKTPMQHLWNVLFPVSKLFWVFHHFSLHRHYLAARLSDMENVAAQNAGYRHSQKQKIYFHFWVENWIDSGLGISLKYNYVAKWLKCWYLWVYWKLVLQARWAFVTEKQPSGTTTSSISV